MSTYWKIKFKELIKFAEKYAYKFTLTSLWEVLTIQEIQLSLFYPMKCVTNALIAKLLHTANFSKLRLYVNRH